MPKPEEPKKGKPPEETPAEPPAPAPPKTDATPAKPPEPVKRAREWFDHLGMSFLKPEFDVPVKEPKPKE